MRVMQRGTAPRRPPEVSRRFRSYSAVLVATGVVCLAGAVACARWRKAPPPDAAETPALPTTLIIIDTRQATDLPPRFFGLSVDTVSSPLSYGNPRLTKALRPLRPGALSYPGGLAANCWEWVEGLMGREWIAQLPDTPAASARPALRAELTRVATLNVLKGGSPLQSFLVACKQLKADPICTANVLCQKPEDSAKWMLTAQAMGQPVLNWELGRRLWQREYRRQVPSAAEYVRRARAHAEAMRLADPTVQLAVGIPADALEALDTPTPTTNTITGATPQAVPTPQPASFRGSASKSVSAADALKIPLVPSAAPKVPAGPAAGAASAPTPTPTPKKPRPAQPTEGSFLRAWAAELARQTFYDAVALDLNFALRMDRATSPELMQYAICRSAPKHLASLLRERGDWFRDKKIWVSEWGVAIDGAPDFPGSLLQALTLADMAVILASQAPHVLCWP